MQNSHILILASSSVTRRNLLDRLRIPYEIDKPEIDETLHAGETAQAACLRLAQEKAMRVAKRHPGAVVIGSDQLVESEGRVFGKPGHVNGAQAQLQSLSGRLINFHVAVAVLAPDAAPQFWHEIVVVQMRTLSNEEISRYIQLETPFDSAGSMKSEGLGATLIESMQSNDPSAILGLPLIATARLLRAVGLDPLRQAVDV
jgi:septum formation protein